MHEGKIHDLLLVDCHAGINRDYCQIHNSRNKGQQHIGERHQEISLLPVLTGHKTEQTFMMNKVVFKKGKSTFFFEFRHF